MLFSDGDLGPLQHRISEASTPRSAPMEEMGQLMRISTWVFAKGAAAISTAGFHVLRKAFGTLIPDHIINVALVLWAHIRRGTLVKGLQATLASFVEKNAGQNIKLVRHTVGNRANCLQNEAFNSSCLVGIPRCSTYLILCTLRLQFSGAGRFLGSRDSALDGQPEDTGCCFRETAS